MVQRDRTNELQSIIGTLKSKPGGVSPAPADFPRRETRSEFLTFATHVTSELQEASQTLTKLARLTRQRNLFEDNQAEVQELSLVVKQKIGMLHSDLQKLQQIGEARQGWGGSTQADKHSSAVVNTLRAQLLDTTKVFKDVLQSRTTNLKETYSRRSQFTADPARLARGAFDDEGSSHGDGQVGGLQAYAAPGGGRTYFQARTDAVRQVEATITELGGMFQEFARVVQEQDELILRIDDDIETALTNVNRGQNELLRTLNRISGNRWLILKIFGVLFFFILFFGIFILK
eukprot:RCo005066